MNTKHQSTTFAALNIRERAMSQIPVGITEFLSALFSALRRGLLALAILLLHLSLMEAQSPPGFGLAFLPEITVATNVATANSDYTTPGRPGVGCDGTNYLVVSCRFDSAPLGLFGVRVSARGTVLNSFFITAANQFANPSVAFDGTNFLVVFQRGGGIYGIRVSPGGQPLDGPDGFSISTDSSNWGANAVFDGLNYLVVWDKYSTNYDIYGARVTPRGQVLGEFPIFTAAGEQVFSAVAFAGSNSLVVWRDTRNGSGPSSTTDIYGTRVSPQGVVLDPTGIPICTAPEVQAEPAVAFDRQNYFVVWDDGRRQDGLLHIIGARVSPAGVLLDGPADSGGIVINESPVSKSYPRLAFDGRDLLVTWWVNSYWPPSGIFGARVSQAGQLVDGLAAGSGIQIAAPDCFPCRLALPNLACNGQSALVPFLLNSEAYGQAKSVLARLIVPQPTITQIQITQGNPADLTLLVGSRNGQRFSIETSTDPVGSAVWDIVATNLVGDGGIQTVPLPNAVVGPVGFFRLRVDY